MISYTAKLLICMALCSSCSLGPEYLPPEAKVACTWKNTTASGYAAAYDDDWWMVFEDAELNQLEKQALTYNCDLKIAFRQLEEARELMHSAQSQLYPHLNLKPYYKNSGELYESYSNGVIVRAHEMLYLLPLILTYEVDLWGKIRNRVHAAQHRWEEELQIYKQVMLVLTTDLATAYYQLRTLDAQIDILNEVSKNRLHAARILTSRYTAKVASNIDAARAQVEVTNIRAKLQEIIGQRKEKENQIAVLVGANPSEFNLPQSALKGTPPQIPAGIPSEVLMRRPDISAIERRIAQNHALIKSAHASFFPSLSLTGIAGFSSPHFRFFLHNYSRWWEYDLEGGQVLYDGGELAANFNFQIQRFKAAEMEYQQIVLTSLKEVEDALSNIESFTKASDDISASVVWAEKVQRIATNRYQKGLTFYLDVIISQNETLAAQFQQNNLRGLRFIATVQLIKALGGGW